MDHYLLDGHTARAVSWDEWLKNWPVKPDDHRVGLTKLAGDIEVSTVFLGRNHNWADGPPLLFETMIFGGEHDQDCWRWTTWEEAESGHTLIVAALQAGRDPSEVIA